MTFISPYRKDRDAVRASLKPREFVEVYIKVSLETAEKRDPKGLYAKAAMGALKNFTGVDSPYEPPLNPELILRTADASPDELADWVIRHLRAQQMIP